MSIRAKFANVGSRYLNLTSYYQGTWSLLLVFMWFLVISVFDKWILPSCAFLYCLLQVHKWIQGRSLIPVWLGSSIALVSLSIGVGDFAMNPSINRLPEFLIVCLLSLTFALFGMIPAYRLHWLQFSNVVLIFIGSLLREGGLTSFALSLPIFLLMILQMNAANMYFYLRDGAGWRATLRIDRGLYIRNFFITYLIGLVFAVGVFYGFPRAKELTLFTISGEEGSETGYTGAVDFAGSSPIAESKRINLVVEGEGVNAIRSKSILWKGAHLESFEDHKWRRRGRSLLPGEVKPPDSEESTKEMASFTVMREPTPLLDLFYPGDFLAANASTRTPASVQFLPARGLFLTQPAYRRILYDLKVHLGPSAFPPDILKSIPPTDRDFSKDEVWQHLLFVPEDILLDPEFRQWIARFEGVRGAAGTIERLDGIFKKEFIGSMQNSISDERPIVAFLARHKRGHCEFFASAAVLTLRAGGVPARLAVGYRGGDYNQFSKAIEIRALHAHAWAEVFHTQLGWIPLDFSPQFHEEMASLGPKPWQQLLSSTQFWFQKYVMDYNRDTQREILAQLRSSIAPEETPGERGARKFLWRWLGGTAALVLMGAFLWQWRRRKIPRQRSRQLSWNSRKLLLQLRFRGFVRAAAEPYSVFFARVTPSLPKHLQGQVRRAEPDLMKALYGPIEK
jgi:hypothetical protein